MNKGKTKLYIQINLSILKEKVPKEYLVKLKVTKVNKGIMDLVDKKRQSALVLWCIFPSLRKKFIMKANSCE